MLVPMILLAACKQPKTIEYYRKNDLDRDRVVNRCLATNANDWDCVNAITAEAERWGSKDIDGYTVMISGDTAGPVQATSNPSSFTENPSAAAAPKSGGKTP